MQKNTTGSNTTAGTLSSFDVFLERLNKTRTTGWRWRRDGVIQTVNVFGKLYITREEIARFEVRAISGEFHKAAITPSRKAAPLSA
jgi:hypothetical protein